MSTASRRTFLQISAAALAGGAATRIFGTADIMNAESPPSTQPLASYLWLASPSRNQDLYGAFRGSFDLPADAEIEIHILAAHWFTSWLDGQYLTEGPARFESLHPEYEEIRINCRAGTHCLALLVHSEGVSTRLLRGDLIPPFVHVRLSSGGAEIPVSWKCRELAAYRATNTRISLQLGWIEWCDKHKLPRDWQAPGFAGDDWADPVQVQPQLGQLRSLSINRVHLVAAPFQLLSRGRYKGPAHLHCGSAGEDIPIGLDSRALDTGKTHDGVWRRYDLGQVRLVRPRLRLNVPAGTAVDFIYAETLSRGTVSPLIPLSCGPSCNFDHYTAGGGEEEFGPVTPKGCRFVEVHVSGPESGTRFVQEEFLERTYFTGFAGRFECEDELLNQVWGLGPSTLRACTEDAVVDNPTRERGQWTGDVVSVGGDIMSVLSGDLRLIRRGLLQSAWCANEDGIVAGLSPGGTTHVSTYALQWVSAVVHYWRLTGDRAILNDLHEAAEKNLRGFEKHRSSEVLGNVPGTWPFIDWGYVAPKEGPDLALNIHYALALQDMAIWAERIRPGSGKAWSTQAEQVLNALRPAYEGARDTEDLNALGYHAAALGFHADLWSNDQKRLALEGMKRHILNSFPNDPSAPRLTNPTVQERRLITPYFAHYAFQPLIENGDMDFVLDQYRKCWGWALDQGCTTMLEVFDIGWSHCHQWSCCPTWQLSRYALGLHSRGDLGKGYFELSFHPGSLRRAEGTIPIPGSDEVVNVSWTAAEGGFSYTLKSPVPLTLVDREGKLLHRIEVSPAGWHKRLARG